MESDAAGTKQATAAGAAPPAGPGRMMLARRSFIFPDMDAAQQFQVRMQSGYRGDRLTAPRDVWSWYNEAPGIAHDYGGQMFRSTYGREVRVYGYQQSIYTTDREYLFDRDPTAGMLVEQYNKVWNGLPLSYIPEVDAYFAEQIALGLLVSLQAGYQEYWQEGGAFVYCETDRDPLKRVARGERPVAWHFLPAHCIIDNMEDPEHAPLLRAQGNVDPLLDHGIEELSFWPSQQAKDADQPLRVHGSRLIAVNLDPRKQRWWRTNHVPFNRAYDTLWELRDIIFSRTRAHFQGDPIVVDVDITEEAQKLLGFAEMDQKQRDDMSAAAEQAVIDYNSGSKTSFAPVMGFKMRRLGAAQLPDPKEDVMMLSSRLAHSSGIYPVKYVLASTKGSSDVSDQDILILQGNIQDVRHVWGYKHLAKALLMGQVMGVNGLRMQGSHNLPHPRELDWPMLRPLSPRDAAFTEKTDASIARELQEASLVLPARLRRKFPEDTRRPIPLWLAARGRGLDGESLDPVPTGGGSSGGAGASSRFDPELEAWMHEHAKPKKGTDDDDEEDEPKPKPKKRKESDEDARKPAP